MQIAIVRRAIMMASAPIELIGTDKK